MRQCLLFIIVLGVFYRGYTQSLLQSLPDLMPYTTNYMFSSYDPSGQNFDGYLGGNYLYSTKKGSIHINHPLQADSSQLEYTMVDFKGNGVMKRFWSARYNPGDTVRFYIDGNPIPDIELTIHEIFYDQIEPFDQGLTFDYSQNTGALLTYTPIYFTSSLIITIDNPIGYYHFNIDRFSKEVPSTDDQTAYISDLKTLFLNAGQQPQSLASSIWETVSFDLEPGETIELFNKIGAKTINGIELSLPEIDTKNSDNLVEDEFKVSIGINSFWLKVNPFASDYKVKYRVLRKIGYNSALIFVNGVYADTWELDPVPIRDNIWVNYEFELPAVLALNNDSVKIEIVPLEFNWVGFTYWMECDGITTDILDIGNEESEASHHYSSDLEGLSGLMKGRYELDENVLYSNSLLLESLNINGYWNGAPIPSISSPVNHFFGMGKRDAPITNGICIGFNDNGFYNYLPMPFSESGILTLTNTNDSIPISNITARIAYSNGVSLQAGNLNAVYKSFSTNPGNPDLELLNVSGQGRIAGLVLNGNGPNISWLEGDERIYIDRLNTPLIYGTGTEDMFNGGDYFLLGERDLPLGSMNFNARNYINMFRTFLPDPIDFRDGIIFNLQRGADNNVVADYNSLIFYYSSEQEQPYIQTDYFNISEDVDSIRNNYVQYGGTYFNYSGFYEGSNDREFINNKGYYGIDSSKFVVNVPSNNGGIVLVRGLNYSFEHQEAEIFVNDQYVGNWLTAGKNEIKTWREDIFIIPPEYTNGQTVINIKVIAKNDTWSEMYYNIHTLRAENLTTGIMDQFKQPTLTADIYPNPMQSSAVVSISSAQNETFDLAIYDLKGHLVHHMDAISGPVFRIDKGKLNTGLYVVKVTDHILKDRYAILKLMIK